MRQLTYIILRYQNNFVVNNKHNLLIPSIDVTLVVFHVLFKSSLPISYSLLIAPYIFFKNQNVPHHPTAPSIKKNPYATCSHKHNNNNNKIQKKHYIQHSTINKTQKKQTTKQQNKTTYN